ncbi:MAG: hypothetical protein U9M98_03630 [Patescibacteria group bacterium]|nr:hypothetical protein [Patescibacteria group bacterium]
MELTTKKIFLISLIIPAVVGGFLFRESLKSFLVDTIYYENINPKAGALHLEKKYRKNYIGAEEASQDADFAIVNMVSKLQNLTEVQGYIDDFITHMDERNSAYKEMLRIGKEQKKLKLAKEYSEFLERRKRADEKDYEAFQAYRNGMEPTFRGMMEIFKFFNIRAELMSNLLAIVGGGPVETISEKFASYAMTRANLITQFNTIEVLYNNGTYEEELFQKIKENKENLLTLDTIIADLKEADPEKIQSKTDEHMEILESLLEQKSGIEEGMFAWSKTNRETFGEEQDRLHKEARSLYQEAYNYAENNDLVILKAWPDKLPGDFSIEETTN